jgi:hypothetical protein
MAHFAVHTPVAQPSHEMDDARNTNETEETLGAFARHASALRNVLYEDKPLKEMEFFFIENHFHTLEMAFLRWKRKHGNIRH